MTTEQSSIFLVSQFDHRIGELGNGRFMFLLKSNYSNFFFNILSITQIKSEFNNLLSTTSQTLAQQHLIQPANPDQHIHLSAFSHRNQGNYN